MPMYRCYQDGIRLKEYNIPTWNKDTFNTKEEAEFWCAYWAYPVSLDKASQFQRPMELNTPVDMSYFGDIEVMMEIREVSSDD